MQCCVRMCTCVCVKHTCLFCLWSLTTSTAASSLLKAFPDLVISNYIIMAITNYENYTYLSLPLLHTQKQWTEQTNSNWDSPLSRCSYSCSLCSCAILVQVFERHIVSMLIDIILGGSVDLFLPTIQMSQAISQTLFNSRLLRRPGKSAHLTELHLLKYH